MPHQFRGARVEGELFKIALASLEAEPIAYIFKHPAGKLFWALTDESNKEQADVIPVYAAAPASVVPDNASASLAYAYKELTPEIMRGHIAVFERYGIAPNDSTTTIQALRIALDGIERSNAMLNGDEPVSQTYKLNELSGNSPGAPDSWISCSERMPEKSQNVLISVNIDSEAGPLIYSARYIGDTFRRGGIAVSPGNDLGQVTHWMPLPEPPLEVSQ
ncbi:DUF551 domain-containing protein [Escherichia albertii]|uniref:DUF551 domain-containing protein n=1 Tax=Escherichia albertii TaxID=208962 RepID=UPI00211A4464|nr:DUF551 domain-containing protein [Escherichia albertii]MCQ8999957.1 DUF551 domain-containing protein [Escherichia albertii]UUK76972.1 DUF551 domain-containing protein [Escherichia albertii]UUK81429.1 DUF551 domain-containing protein [Escherichia albertii]UUK99609.1 DUF551 domain-containing protein [Escherichia albertii]UUL08493.1 DUF551 domain-containing protein [Escherichia albertii]